MVKQSELSIIAWVSAVEGSVTAARAVVNSNTVASIPGPPICTSKSMFIASFS